MFSSESENIIRTLCAEVGRKGGVIKTNEDGWIHCKDGPAIVLQNGTQAWVVNNILHREDGPAAVFSGNDLRDISCRGEHWYQHGWLHREDGPAIESESCSEWYMFGKLHRIDGAAVTRWMYGKHVEEWHLNGKLHRLDGPAKLERGENDKWLSEKWYYEGRLHRLDGPAVKESSGHEEWWKHGERHREDGPAIIEQDGDKQWYLEGKHHREDGPAIQMPTISIFQWYHHGKLHREDGPAEARSLKAKDGIYWIDGKEITKDEFKIYKKKSKTIIIGNKKFKLSEIK